MATPDLLPPSDSDFDTLQEGLVALVVANAVAWDIPADEVTKLTDAQTPWTTTWAIAKHKTSATTAQREAKDEARKDYGKVLRPFIQKWLYRNDSVTNENIVDCGLKPRDTTRTPSSKPLMTNLVTAKRGIPLQIITTCPKIDGVKYYGCILVPGNPLPPFVYINSEGALITANPDPAPGPGPGSGSGNMDFRMSLTEQREKVFSNLQHDVTYYIYYYLVNSAGVSPLSEPASIVCW